MMDSSDDEIYPTNNAANEPKVKNEEDAEEEGEEVEDDSDVYSPPEDTSDALADDDSQEDINFITDAKEESKPEVKPYVLDRGRGQILTEMNRQPKQRQASGTQRSESAQRRSLSPHSQRRQRTSQSAAVEIKPDPSDVDTRELPPRHTSKINVNDNPVHPATGKPIMSTDFDADFTGENAKPWRRPGADITDFFNYGFDEFTWASYCLKQKDMPKEVKAINAEAEQMKAFVEGIGGPGMPGVPTGPGGAQGGAALNGGMGGMPGMPSEAEMASMFQAMSQQGIDPSQMDQNQFMQTMMGMGMQGGMQGGPPHGPGGFGGGDGGFQGGGGGGGGGYGGGRGRGRRGRGNW
jgi:pre-mRNA 3'-end-processing factor FIP1